MVINKSVSFTCNEKAASGHSPQKFSLGSNLIFRFFQKYNFLSLSFGKFCITSYVPKGERESLQRNAIPAVFLHSSFNPNVPLDLMAHGMQVHLHLRSECRSCLLGEREKERLVSGASKIKPLQSQHVRIATLL